jgi:hypothetical protein
MARSSQSMFAKLSIAVANTGCKGLTITHVVCYTFCHILLCSLSHLFYGTMQIIYKKSVTWFCIRTKPYSVFEIILLIIHNTVKRGLSPFYISFFFFFIYLTMADLDSWNMVFCIIIDYLARPICWVWSYN